MPAICGNQPKVAILLCFCTAVATDTAERTLKAFSHGSLASGASGPKSVAFAAAGCRAWAEQTLRGEQRLHQLDVPVEVVLSDDGRRAREPRGRSRRHARAQARQLRTGVGQDGPERAEIERREPVGVIVRAARRD